jgi:hypothetical protein
MVQIRKHVLSLFSRRALRAFGGSGLATVDAGSSGCDDRMTDESISRDEVVAIGQRYEVQPRDWLELEPAYAGTGVARFMTNPGTISGPTRVRYAEDGSLTEFNMAAAHLESETPIDGPGSLFVFVNALPIPDSPGSFSFGPRSNECASVELSGEGFTLAADQRSSVIASAGDSAASFRPYRTIVRFAETASPFYWIAPLLNFVVDFSRVAPSLQEHPLRTRATAPLTAAEGPVRLYHESFYRAGNALIPFLCEGESAFIEPLADYDERRARVESGDIAITAVAVGRTSADFDLGASDWFPADLVTLLGLSSGRTVGVPFVEIRGAAGELVARMHVRIGDAGETRGTALIDEQINGTTGALLTSFLVSDVRNEVWFRVMLKHLLRVFTGGGTVEDRLSHLFRGVEGACAGLRLNKARPIEVEESVRTEVETGINELIDKLGEIAARSSEADRARLTQLRNRLRTVTANSPSFPTQLLALLDKVELPDADWLAHFKFRVKNERPGGQSRTPSSWASAAGVYRNRIFHSAFIDFDTYDVDNTFAFIGHLSDVLARVVFHLIGFVGQYKPPCGYAGAVTYETPSWARPERLSADVFRYTG